MIKVSIIVPIYNNEDYVERCIESLLNQTLKEIEVIIIDDGSTDNSLYICKNLSKKDNRIKIISTKNNGVSIARNIGLDIANGKYIAFVDSDDYIDIDMYSNMYDLLEKTNSDLCMCNYIKENQNNKKYIDSKIHKQILIGNEIYDEIIIPLIGETSIDQYNGMSGFRGPVMYMYLNDVIKKYSIKFKEDLPIGEDFVFNINYITKINKVCIDKGFYYHYYENQNSAMKSYRNNWWKEHINLISSVENALQLNTYENDIQKRLYVMKIKYLVGGIVNECSYQNKKTYIDKIKAIREICNNPIIREAIYKYDYRKLKGFRYIWYLLIKYRFCNILYFYYKLKISI